MKITVYIGCLDSYCFNMENILVKIYWYQNKTKIPKENKHIKIMKIMNFLINY